MSSRVSHHQRSLPAHGPSLDLCTLAPAVTPTVKCKTLAGLPSWPSDLKLSLTAENWLEWSRCLMRILSTTQLDEYPLGLLQCPDARVDPHGQSRWSGNDRMIIAYMKWQMSSAEIYHIATCQTSADVFRSLRKRHEKRSGLTQLRLIKKLMQISFDDEAEKFDGAVSDFRDLVYRIESIGQVDVLRLGLISLVLNLKNSHPAVHDALVPCLMDDSISIELLEDRMHYHFAMRDMHSNHSFLRESSITLPAHLPPRTILCPNCKRSGHAIEFCVAPGGIMEGPFISDAITRQRAAQNSNRARPRDWVPSAAPPFKFDDDGSLWIGGTRYRPEGEGTATIADASVSPFPITDQGESYDWAQSSDPPLDTSVTSIASDLAPETALLSQFFLDSGASLGTSSHISCNPFQKCVKERGQLDGWSAYTLPRTLGPGMLVNSLEKPTSSSQNTHPIPAFPRSFLPTPPSPFPSPNLMQSVLDAAPSLSGRPLPIATLSDQTGNELGPTEKTAAHPVQAAFTPDEGEYKDDINASDTMRLKSMQIVAACND